LKIKNGVTMPTLMLFRENPYIIEFEAKVVSIDSNRVVLDQTAFFPQGGGQVGDVGEINGINVINTLKDEALNVIHFLDSEPNFKVDDIVHGRIDWKRRYKIMRLHSAAHIVYYVMHEVFGKECKTASSGLLDDEKDRSDYLFEETLDKEKLRKVEERVNEIISKNYEIKTWGDNKNQDHRYWKIELFEIMSCGGTHVKNTKEIGETSLKRGKKPGKGKERIEIALMSPSA